MIRAALVAVSAFAVSSALAPHVPVSPASSPATGAAPADFHWSGTVPTGGWLRIRNLAGNVEVRRSTSNTVDVSATPEPESDRWLWNRGPTEPVSFVQKTRGSDVLICAVSRSVSECNPDDLNSPETSTNWQPQPMHVIVRLPAGVSIQTGTMHGDLVIAQTQGSVNATTGHGSISIRDVAGLVSASSGHGDIDINSSAGRVSARTGHGDIHVDGSAAVRASTGHGDITATLARAGATGLDEMSFSTGHGNIAVRAPASLAGDIDLHTGRGSVSTDFPLASDNSDNAGRRSRSEAAHGQLGGSSRAVRLSSGHGDVSLTRGD